MKQDLFCFMTVCPKGYFGPDCLHKCSTYCSGNESCNRFTGVCDEGCKDGWSGPICGTRIASGMYGTVVWKEIFDVNSMLH